MKNILIFLLTFLFIIGGVAAQDCEDYDGDGYCADEDCDDYNDKIYPLGNEICYDEVDNNCNERIDEIGCVPYMCFRDEDCYAQDPNPEDCQTFTCNQDNECIGSASTYICMEKHNQESICIGPPYDIGYYRDGCTAGCLDYDGDGYCYPEDCNDEDELVTPLNEGICDDGIDNNCNGKIDEEDDSCTEKSDIGHAPEFGSNIIVVLITVGVVGLIVLAKVK